MPGGASEPTTRSSTRRWRPWLPRRSSSRSRWAADRALYRPFFHLAQEEVVRAFHNLAAVVLRDPRRSTSTPPSPKSEKDLGLVLSPTQRLAIKECFQKKILVITGGPGTGKTTIIKAVVDVFRRWGTEVLLAAPTGRAAKRLSETTGREARTIHRVLEFKPKQGTFRRGAKCPLQGEALIIDEFSMVDLPLMHHLLKAVPAVDAPHPRRATRTSCPRSGRERSSATSSNPGPVTVVRLDEIFRQDKESFIVLNAHRINQGQGLVYPAQGRRRNPISIFIRQEDEREGLRDHPRPLPDADPPLARAFPPSRPRSRSSARCTRACVGVDSLNLELQQRLNPLQEGLKWGTREFRVRDKVMQIRNDYEKEVFNGDIGIVVHIDRPRFRIIVDFDGRPVVYEKDDLNDLTLAYAVSVHKAQGSEYQAVVMPLLTQHFIMLQRNLFYTALTRAKKLSVIVGSYKALYIAIKNDKPVKRNSLVKEKLIELSRG